jgi:hypothetical protein
MKNQYNDRLKQIEKSVRGDWTQNPDYCREQFNKDVKRKQKDIRGKLVIVNGEFKRLLKNGIPSTWEDDL